MLRESGDSGLQRRGSTSGKNEYLPGFLCRGTIYKPVWCRGAIYKPVWCISTIYKPVWCRGAIYKPVWCRGAIYKPVCVGARFISPGRCLFQDRMRIGATYAERADACAEWIGSGLPGHRSAIDVKGTIGKINLRIGFLIMETGWKPAMMQCQNGFDKTNDPGSTISMSYIRFHRAD